MYIVSHQTVTALPCKSWSRLCRYLYMFTT